MNEQHLWSLEHALPVRVCPAEVRPQGLADERFVLGGAQLGRKYDGYVGGDWRPVLRGDRHRERCCRNEFDEGATVWRVIVGESVHGYRTLSMTAFHMTSEAIAPTEATLGLSVCRGSNEGSSTSSVVARNSVSPSSAVWNG